MRVFSAGLCPMKSQSEGESRSVMSDSLWPHELSSWNSLGQNTGVGSLYLLRGIFPTQRSNPGLPHCRRIPLPVEPQGQPKNTGVGSLALLQLVFPTQESIQGLLQRRQILYQRSCEGSPLICPIASHIMLDGLCHRWVLEKARELLIYAHSATRV